MHAPAVSKEEFNRWVAETERRLFFEELARCVEDDTANHQAEQPEEHPKPAK